MSRTDCDNGMSCLDFKCDNGQARRSESEQRTRLGLVLGIYTGLGGNLANGSVEASFGPEISFGLGPIRYHGSLVFDSVNGYSGGRVDLLGFGVPIRVATIGGKNILEVEPTVSLFTTEWLASHAFQMFGSSMLGVQVNLGMDRLYISLQPLGFELREYSWQGDHNDNSFNGGVGVNYVLRASGGVQF
jgi:hypothetical protein